MGNTKAWLEALRLRTLPLALASTGMGNFLAAGFRVFNLKVCLLTSLTAVLLQVLSNLANDYGDYKSGAADNDERIGPQRGLQSGSITIAAMRNAIIITTILTLISGCLLLYIAVPGIKIFVIYFALGILCIIAAMKYTMGKRPYGYSGLGDFAVFIFFGLVGVCGTYYLHAGGFRLLVLFPALALGFLSAGVLNINNMRDIDNDAAAGKRTLVVHLGLNKAKIYHFFLIIAGVSCMLLASLTITYVCYHTGFYSRFDNRTFAPFLCFISIPLFVKHLKLINNASSDEMDSYLKQLAIMTIGLVICFGVGLIIAAHE